MPSYTSRCLLQCSVIWNKTIGTLAQPLHGVMLPSSSTLNLGHGGHKVIVKETSLKARNCGLVVFYWKLSIQCVTAGTFSPFFFQRVNESESPISLLQTILLMCEVSLLMILHNISKRVRFKTEGWNNPLQLSAVGLSFWWLWKLHIFFGRHQTP